MSLIKIRRALMAPAAAAGLSLIISCVALLVAGYSPVSGMRAMWDNINGSDGIVTILNYSGRYYVMGVAVAVGFKMNLFNIGANGQYQVGALFAGAVGGALHLPPITIVIMLLVAMAGGGVWALIPGVMNTQRKVHIVIATIMLNYVATGLTAWLLRQLLPDSRPARCWARASRCR